MQTHDGLRASMDSVLLAALVQAKKGERLLDMGCGTGAVGLCVNDRLKDRELMISGIDHQEKMILLAEQNARANGLCNRCWYITADVTDRGVFDRESFDHIVMNPPYYDPGKRLQSPDPARETAFSTDDLSQWIGSALHWVRQGGSLSMIYPASGLSDSLSLVTKGFGAIEILPVYSKPQDPAIRVILRMIRNRKTPLVLHPPIVMCNPDGSQSDQAIAILRDGEGMQV